MSTRVQTEASVAARHVEGVTEHRLLPGAHGSALSASTVRIEAGVDLAGDTPGTDELIFAFEGAGEIEIDEHRGTILPGTAALVTDGERSTLTAGPEGLAVVRFTVAADVDLHAPMGARSHTVDAERVEPGEATGSRSFQVLFGPHNGSTRATLFVGHIPPGRSPWHYHLYDEIVWVWRGPGRFHLEPRVEELPDHAAFRLAPREVHIVENTRSDAELVVLGLFTPAGSPSAAYLTAESAASYAIAPG